MAVSSTAVVTGTVSMSRSMVSWMRIPVQSAGDRQSLRPTSRATANGDRRVGVGHPSELTRCKSQRGRLPVQEVVGH